MNPALVPKPAHAREGVNYPPVTRHTAHAPI